MKKLLIAGYEEATRNYRSAFGQLGIFTESLGSDRELDFFDGLVLPGGGDITPVLLGVQNPEARNVDELLDLTQFSLLGTFLRMGKPVLGICKGLQLINVYFGGTLIQDLPEDSRSIHTPAAGDFVHATKAAKGTFPEQLYGPNPVTNSAHHQAVSAVGDGLLIAQYTCDFVIEAMYHKSLPVLGVQWHPERMCFAHADPQMDDGALLLRYFASLL